MPKSGYTLYTVSTADQCYFHGNHNEFLNKNLLKIQIKCISVHHIYKHTGSIYTEKSSFMFRILKMPEICRKKLLFTEI